MQKKKFDDLHDREKTILKVGIEFFIVMAIISQNKALWETFRWGMLVIKCVRKKLNKTALNCMPLLGIIL